MGSEIGPSLSWMSQFAFWASLILTVFKIIELVTNAMRRPKLDVRVTPEVFFRLTEYGETIFCNSVLLAWNGPILIADTRAILKKTDSPIKSYPFKILEFGEKVKGTGPLPENYFHSRSAITHLAESEPQRTLYFCVQEKYQDQSRNAVNEFQKQVLEYKQGVLSQAANVSSEGRGALQQEILRNVNQIVDVSLGKMMELIQLEPGQYKLTLEVDFNNPKARIFTRTATERSSIAFEIAPDIRDRFRVNLRQALLLSATNLIFDQQTQIIYPEYVPLKIKITESSDAG